MTIREYAPAKVNLYLHVTGKRMDGYHTLDSLVVFAGAADRLEATAAAELSLRIDGPFAAGLLPDADNLVLRAARALAEAAGVSAGARLVLSKHLPVASGIGGGSADAAATLRALHRLWGLDLDRADLLRIAAGLGADVPVCLACAPSRMSGIGERLAPCPALPAFGIVLINPGQALPTRAVFGARGAGFSEPARLSAAWTNSAALLADLDATANDLEAPAIGLCPAIAEGLAALRGDPGCGLARMSGSGATCFGLYRTPAEAGLAAARLARSGWWVWGGGKPGFTETGAVSY